MTLESEFTAHKIKSQTDWFISQSPDIQRQEYKKLALSVLEAKDIELRLTRYWSQVSLEGKSTPILPEKTKEKELIRRHLVDQDCRDFFSHVFSSRKRKYSELYKTFLEVSNNCTKLQAMNAKLIVEKLRMPQDLKEKYFGSNN